MKNTILLLLAMAMIAMTACKSLRRTQEGTLKPKSEKVLMKHLIANQVNAEWLGGRAKVTYQDEYGRESFTAYLRMQKDSAIWVSFRKFSIEGARALITPDSIYVLDRLNNEYMVKPFAFLQRQYRLPVSFHGFQAMLLGNPVFFSNNTEVVTDSTRYQLMQKTDNLIARYWIDGIQYLLEETHIEDFRNRRALTVEASDYQLLSDKQNFSYFRSFNLSSPESGDMRIEIDFSKVEINVPQNISFDIPERYEKVD